MFQNTRVANVIVQRTPTGFNHSAQGCAERATLGYRPVKFQP
jgi:hypothetical protein